MAKSSEVGVPSEINYKDKPNMELLAQAWRVYFDREHVGFNKTLTRSEINKTKAKWYKQKGTGNARHGAKSAPIFVGGGKAHGPKGIKRVLHLPKKMAVKALESAISLKFSDKSVFLLEGVNTLKKTKEANEALNNIAKQGLIYMVLADKNKDARRFFVNIERVNVTAYQNINLKEVLRAGAVVFDSEIFETKKSKTNLKKGVSAKG